jgi:hypothetical protein
MAITGAHMLVYTSEPDAVRDVFRDVLRWPHVDAGEGWLIFRLPPSEIGVHPTEGAASHQISLMCDDVRATVAELRDRPGITVRGEPADHGWGITVMLILPGNLEIMLYEPRHPIAADAV